MKFLVDAQLPIRLAVLLTAEGHDVVHTSELEHGNASTDAQVAAAADAADRVVVTKDRDFRDGHLLMGAPRRLLRVATGNISNTALLSLFERHLGAIVRAFDESDFLVLDADYLLVHPRRRASSATGDFPRREDRR